MDTGDLVTVVVPNVKDYEARIVRASGAGATTKLRWLDDDGNVPLNKIQPLDKIMLAGQPASSTQRTLQRWISDHDRGLLSDSKQEFRESAVAKERTSGMMRTGSGGNATAPMRNGGGESPAPR